MTGIHLPPEGFFEDWRVMWNYAFILSLLFSLHDAYSTLWLPDFLRFAFLELVTWVNRAQFHHLLARIPTSNIVTVSAISFIPIFLNMSTSSDDTQSSTKTKMDCESTWYPPWPVCHGVPHQVRQLLSDRPQPIIRGVDGRHVTAELEIQPTTLAIPGALVEYAAVVVIKPRPDPRF